VGEFADIALRVVITLLLLLAWAMTLGGVLFLLHFLLSLPLRRAERARTILDLIETALQCGEPVEPALISVSQSREQSVGVRFHLFAAWLERGLRLDEALKRVPRLLPPGIVAMLKTGQQMGDLRKILPACRQLLADSVSETRSALNYLVVITFVVSPATIFVFWLTAAVVFPRFVEISNGLGVGQPTGSQLMLSYRFAFIWVQCLLQLFVWLFALVHVLGPRARAWLPGFDRLSWRLPWRRKRMLRDFSVMLATLLDAGMPEPEAVRLAADCTVNSVFQRRATRALHALQQGRSLTDAVSELDDSGEFRWRLTNATHAHSGFLTALGGWHDALNAKAFQNEQAAAHIISTSLVLLNGMFVAAVVISVFSFLISIVNAGVLW